MNLTPPDDTRVNTVRVLCLLVLSIICWGFLPVSFLRNPEKNWEFIVDQRLYISAQQNTKDKVVVKPWITPNPPKEDLENRY